MHFFGLIYLRGVEGSPFYSDTLRIRKTEYTRSLAKYMALKTRKERSVPNRRQSSKEK